ncbi:TlpA family protein disulfide reductase [Treponema zioleckii]|uniref:TlpA family protein disulfide reductase n=1 Tax=Treponema zioleckii TaxID=331680 RepID=UPI00168B8E5A|nr:TlpA disulfide reductase family protein [Treponema zioleckii]
MKKIFAIIALLALTTLSFAQKAGDKISFSATDMSGKTVSSDIFAKNKVTMVNIWGTFCGPCIREMPDLAKLNEANKSNGVEVVGIVIDILDRKGNVDSRVKSSGETIIKQTGANYTHIIPTKEMFSGFLKNIQAVPTTIFVDSNGKQIGEAYLGARSQKDWQKIIDEILKK